jgi:hypothetical protein
MGHIKPKRTVCFVTADGVIHKTKKEAEFHVAHIVHKLTKAKAILAELVTKQKHNKKMVARFIESCKHRKMTGFGSPEEYVRSSQSEVAAMSVHIRYAERNVAHLKKLLRGT